MTKLSCPPAKFKTVLCTHFQERRRCPRGAKCDFAHGEGELRVPGAGERFKTVLCTHFEQGRKCPCGARCHFAHGNNELRTCAQACRPANAQQPKTAPQSAVLSPERAGRPTGSAGEEVAKSKRTPAAVQPAVQPATAQPATAPAPPAAAVHRNRKEAESTDRVLAEIVRKLREAPRALDDSTNSADPIVGANIGSIWGMKWHEGWAVRI